jgi:hypothetical protein
MNEELVDYIGSAEQARDVLFHWIAGTVQDGVVILANGWTLTVEEFYGGPGIEITTPDGHAFVAIIEDAEVCEDDSDD